MNKTTKIILLSLIVIIAIITLVIFMQKPKNEENITNIDLAESVISENLNKDQDLTVLIDKVYERVDLNQFPKLETTTMDVLDSQMVSMLTGLENGNDLETLVISQPLMSSQAYSFILVKVKNGVNANEIAKKMCNNVDTRRWICVEAEQVYSTNSGNIVCLVMASKEQASLVYNSFKKEVVTVGEEYEKMSEVGELSY